LVCSACGFENLAGMRFCGMCGTPMPHRPLTTPGAQSTLSLTRVPLEGAISSSARSASFTSSRGLVSPEIPTGNGDSSSTEPTTSDAANAEDMVDVAQDPAGPPTAELVPDIPLDQYLQSFHYQPPDEPDEMAMREDHQVDEQEASTPKTTVARSTSVEVTKAVDAVASAPAAKTKGPTVVAEAPPDTVESRLGLEPEAETEIPLERPNFLDLGEQPEAEPATSGTSFITGPSFLGLNDPAPTAEARLPKARKLRKSHWRAWSAVLVVLIFAGLGWLQWRSQVEQTNDGPVEIVKAKVRDWRQRIPALNGGGPAPANSADNNSKPEMQVQPQRQPRNQGDNPNGPASDATTGAAGGETSGSNSTPASQSSQPASAVAGEQQATSTQRQTASAERAANDGLSSSAPAETTPASTQKPKPPRPTDVSSQDAAPKPSSAGAEEMAKAKNASDAAATAAWLWKATAKGNPDAPVQLADMYVNGQGVPRSCEQAEVLLKTAAEKQNARARNRLASMYATGTCVQRNRVEAYRWLSSALAANPNSDWAKQNRDLIWQQMTPDERTQAEKYR